MKKEHYGTVIIGAGQAGLSVAYFLKKIDQDFILLDEGSQVGDSWLRRRDSLKLFTGPQHGSLPDFSIPAKRDSRPTKEDMADYLSNYANKYSMPVQLDTKVLELNKSSDKYEIVTSKGKLNADRVIVATGTNQIAYPPAFDTQEVEAPLISVSADNLKEASIVWTTGFRPDFSWIKFDIVGQNGWPQTHRGISDKFKGLYFVGMLFQYALTSGLSGGSSRDAAFVVNHIKMEKAK